MKIPTETIRSQGAEDHVIPLNTRLAFLIKSQILKGQLEPGERVGLVGRNGVLFFDNNDVFAGFAALHFPCCGEPHDASTDDRVVVHDGVKSRCMNP